MRKERVTNAMYAKGTYQKHRKALEKAEEYYNYNTSLGLRRGFILHDALQGQAQQDTAQQGQSIMTNIADVIERFKILYGEITSGNKNINLIKEFREILYYLYKANILTNNTITK